MFKIIKDKLNEDTRIFNAIEELNINSDNINKYQTLEQGLKENAANLSEEDIEGEFNALLESLGGSTDPKGIITNGKSKSVSTDDTTKRDHNDGNHGDFDSDGDLDNDDDFDLGKINNPDNNDSFDKFRVNEDTDLDAYFDMLEEGCGKEQADPEECQDCDKKSKKACAKCKMNEDDDFDLDDLDDDDLDDDDDDEDFDDEDLLDEDQDLDDDLSEEDFLSEDLLMPDDVDDDDDNDDDFGIDGDEDDFDVMGDAEVEELADEEIEEDEDEEENFFNVEESGSVFDLDI